MNNDIIGAWVVAAAAVLGLVLTTKKLFWPDQKREDSFVTQKEFEKFAEAMDRRFAEITRSLAAVEAANVTENKSLREYIHMRVHDMLDKLNETNLGQITRMSQIGIELGIIKSIVSERRKGEES